MGPRRPAAPLLQLLAVARTRSIMAASLRIALFVGTVLNLINQAGPVLDGLPVSWFHVGLNYLVPYCVASYSAARNQTTLARHKSVIESVPPD